MDEISINDDAQKGVDQMLVVWPECERVYFEHFKNRTAAKGITKVM